MLPKVLFARGKFQAAGNSLYEAANLATTLVLIWGGKLNNSIYQCFVFFKPLSIMKKWDMLLYAEGISACGWCYRMGSYFCV